MRHRTFSSPEYHVAWIHHIGNVLQFFGNSFGIAGDDLIRCVGFFVAKDRAPGRYVSGDLATLLARTLGGGTAQVSGRGLPTTARTP